MEHRIKLSIYALSILSVIGVSRADNKNQFVIIIKISNQIEQTMFRDKRKRRPYQ